MKKKDDISSKDVKKTKDRIILITRIVGVLLFLSGIAIIFITSVLRGRNIEENDVIFDSFSDRVDLHNKDEKILENEYLVLNNIDDFNNFVNHIDEWYSDSYTNYSVVVSEYENIDEDRKQKLLDEYKLFNDERYKSLKKLVSIFEQLSS